MKNVLFVFPFLPYPLISGGHQAFYNGIIAAIPYADIFITYPEYYPQDEERASFQSQLDGAIHILPYFDYKSQRGERVLSFIYRTKYLIKSFISGERGKKSTLLPYTEWINQLLPKSDGYIKHINDIIARQHIDIVQCEMLDSLAMVISLPRTVKRIFVHHEIGFIRKALHPVIRHDHSQEGLAHLAVNRMLEVDLLNQYDTVVTLSNTDTEKLKNAGVYTNILTSFAIVNTPPEKNLAFKHSCRLVFIGPEGHPSNRDGLLWFLENCWKRLKEVDPSYQLSVIGVWTSETQKFLSSTYKDVHFLGFVEDLRTTISNSIMIVPIQIGSGIRMKILEACMLGLPVVSTSIGAEGLPLIDGEDCFISDTPEAFLNSILSLKDQDLCRRFISSSQQKILHYYSKESLIENRKGLYS